MNDQVRIALRNYLDALQRSADTSEALADHLVALNNVVGARPDSPRSVQPLLDQARRHRIDALTGRSKIVAVTRQFAQFSEAGKGRRES